MPHLETPSRGEAGFRISERRVGGKYRMIGRPTPEMQELHRGIIGYLREIWPDLPHATGGVPGESARTNALRHRGNRYLLLADITDAYGAVRPAVLASVLAQHDPRVRGREERLRRFLERYCFFGRGGLVLGAPASVDLFNRYADSLIDRHLSKIARRRGWTYTRYLDDLALSSAKKFLPEDLELVRGVVLWAGFRLNDRIRFRDIHKSTVQIAGVSLERDGRVHLSQKQLARIRGAIHLADQGQLDPSTVHGLMGYFWSVTDRSDWLTHTELKIVWAYRAYCKSLPASA